jgi:hypothetical protein
MAKCPAGAPGVLLLGSRQSFAVRDKQPVGASLAETRSGQPSGPGGDSGAAPLG